MRDKHLKLWHALAKISHCVMLETLWCFFRIKEISNFNKSSYKCHNIESMPIKSQTLSKILLISLKVFAKLSAEACCDKFVSRRERTQPCVEELFLLLLFSELIKHI